MISTVPRTRRRPHDSSLRERSGLHHSDEPGLACMPTARCFCADHSKVPPGYPEAAAAHLRRASVPGLPAADAGEERRQQVAAERASGAPGAASASGASARGEHLAGHVAEHASHVAGHAGGSGVAATVDAAHLPVRPRFAGHADA